MPRSRNAAYPLTAALLAVAGVAVLAAGLRAAPPPDDSTVFRLKNVKPSEVITYLVPPPEPTGDPEAREAQERRTLAVLGGVDAISPDDAGGRLIVRGTPEARQRLTNMVQLLDVERKRVRLEARLVRFLPPSRPGGRPRPETVATAVLEARSNERLETCAYVKGLFFVIVATPHVNGDNSVVLTATLSGVNLGGARGGGEPGLRARKIRDGEAAVFTGTTTSPDPAVRQAVLQAVEVPVAAAPPEQTFYLEVTPRVLIPPPAAAR